MARIDNRTARLFIYRRITAAAQHLVVLLDPADIVSGIQDAYARPEFHQALTRLVPICHQLSFAKEPLAYGCLNYLRARRLDRSSRRRLDERRYKLAQPSQPAPRPMA
jgi:hypothetical protein